MATYNDKNTAMVIFAKSDVAGQMPNVNSTTPQLDPPQPVNEQISDTPKKASINLGSLKKIAVSYGILRAGKSVINYYKNNYGAIHQDSLAQAHINETLQILGVGASIGSGFLMGGWVGGIAATIGEGVGIGLQEMTYQRTLKRSQASSDVMYARVGLASISGGR